MRLAPFILANIDAILDEWEKFARAIPAAQDFNSTALRDHAKGMLEVIAADLGAEQSAVQQEAKSQGRATTKKYITEAGEHGISRVAEGFSVNNAMAEFRALRASVLRLFGEQHASAAAVPDDITRFNEAIDEALTESLARYSAAKDRQARLFDTLLSTSPDLSYIFEPDGEMIYANKAFARAVGRPAKEILTTNIFNVCPTLARECRMAAAKVVASGSANSAELPPCARKEAFVIYEYLLVPVFDTDGRCEAIAGTARDITERKVAEEVIRHSANYDQLTDLPNRSLIRLDRTRGRGRSRQWWPANPRRPPAPRQSGRPSCVLHVRRPCSMAAQRKSLLSTQHQFWGEGADQKKPAQGGLDEAKRLRPSCLPFPNGGALRPGPAGPDQAWQPWLAQALQ